MASRVRRMQVSVQEAAILSLIPSNVVGEGFGYTRSNSRLIHTWTSTNAIIVYLYTLYKKKKHKLMGDSH